MIVSGGAYDFHSCGAPEDDVDAVFPMVSLPEGLPQLHLQCSPDRFRSRPVSAVSSKSFSEFPGFLRDLCHHMWLCTEAVAGSDSPRGAESHQSQDPEKRAPYLRSERAEPTFLPTHSSTLVLQNSVCM